MKCPYCGWGVVDNKCIRCCAEVKSDKEETPKTETTKITKEKKNGN